MTTTTMMVISTNSSSAARPRGHVRHWGSQSRQGLGASFPEHPYTPAQNHTPTSLYTPNTLPHPYTNTNTDNTPTHRHIYHTHKTHRDTTLDRTGGYEGHPHLQEEASEKPHSGRLQTLQLSFLFFGLFCFFSPRKRKNPQVLEKERGYFDPARVGAVSADSSGSVSGRSAGGHAQCQQSPQQWQVRGWGPGQ